jgi:hypothetical protein
LILIQFKNEVETVENALIKELMTKSSQKEKYLIETDKRNLDHLDSCLTNMIKRISDFEALTTPELIQSRSAVAKLLSQVQETGKLEARFKPCTDATIEFNAGKELSPLMPLLKTMKVRTSKVWLANPFRTHLPMTTNTVFHDWTGRRRA